MKDIGYYKVSDICEITRGKVYSKNYIKNNLGEYPLYSSQTFKDGLLGKINTYDYNGEYVNWTTDGANAGSIFYRKGKFSVTNVSGLLKVKDQQIIISKYLYYILSIFAKRFVNKGMGNPKLMSNVMGKIMIPVPSLEVQNEIVRILDKFTELEAELETELEARLQQYNYYLHNILTNEWNKVHLEKVADIVMGTSPKGNSINDRQGIEFHQGKTHFGKKVIGVSGRYTTRAIKLAPKDSIIMSVRAPVGDINITNREIAIGRGLCSIKSKTPDLNNNYLYFYLLLIKDEIMETSTGSTFQAINSKEVKSIKIKIPPIEVQNKIVAKLDKFSELAKDIKTGLPKEIELRRKQYEYYRDKLLTFE